MKIKNLINLLQIKVINCKKFFENRIKKKLGPYKINLQYTSLEEINKKPKGF